jgi:hypothetical protein
MRHIIKFAALTLTLSATAVHSQDGMMGIGVAVVGQFPVGDFAQSAGFGLGGMGGIEVGAIPGLAVTARSGYIQYFEKRDNTISYIPIMGGAKASAVEGAAYLAGEIGAVITRQDYSGSNILRSDVNETNLGWGLGLGSMSGPLDLRISFNVWDAGHAKESMTIGLSFGLTLWSL